MKVVMYVWGAVLMLTGIGEAIFYLHMRRPDYGTAAVWLAAGVGCGFLLFRVGKLLVKPQNIRNGVNGTATIVGFRAGGMRLEMGANTSLMVVFTLDVNVPGLAPYRVTGFKAMLPEIRLGMLRPGAQVAVRVDRTNARRMALDLDAPVGEPMTALTPYGAMSPANPYAPAGGIPGPQASAGQMAAAFQQLAMQGQLGAETAQLSHSSAAELLARGTPGRASVLTATPTGQALADGRFVYAFTMQVWRQGAPQPIEAAILHAVPPWATARAVPGSSLAVAIDPIDPTRSVAIDWNRP